MDARRPIELDLATLVPEPPATALPWERLRQRALRRRRRRSAAGAAAVASVLFVGAGGLWRSTTQPERVRLPVPAGTAVSGAPSRPPHGGRPATTSAQPSSGPRTVAPAEVRFGDVDGDHRPDRVTLTGRRLTVSFATGGIATRAFPASGGAPYLQAVADLAGVGYAQILIGGTAAGCCANRPVNLVSQLLVYRRGALQPVATRGGQPFELQFSSGRGEVYAGATCRAGGRIEQDVAGLGGPGGYTLTRIVYVITAATARVVSVRRSTVAGGSGAQQAVMRATRSHCPGLPLDGIPASGSRR